MAAHGRGPAALRGVVMAIHWTALIVIVGWLFGAVPGVVVAVHAGLWGTITAIWGLRGGPSPALRGAARTVAHLSHVALLGLYLAGAALALPDHPLARPLLLATLAASTLHAVWNLYRAGVLGDGAFRRMLPKALL